MKGKKCSIWMELTLKSHVAENLKKKTQTPKKFIQISHTSRTKADILANGHIQCYPEQVIKT